MPFRKQDSSVFDNFELRLNDRSQKFLRETCRWVFILAIIGFVVSGLLLFIGIFALIFFNDVNTQGVIPVYMLSSIYIVIAVIGFFPSVYMYSFSRRMANALREKNTEDLTAAFSKLKSYFKFLGIAALIMIAFYIIAFLFAIFVGVNEYTFL
jgi:uncharacterized integral membrane protein